MLTKKQQIKLFSPIKLTQEDLLEAKQSVVKLFGRKDLEIEEIVDPKMLGGIVVQVGTQVIDLSLLGKLRSIRKHLIHDK